MLNSTDILETIKMIQEENLDIRTITMGISLLDCIDSDIDKACDKVYDKIMRKAENLVKTGEDIEKQYGIPIVNKRISVTPIAMVSAACKGSPVKFAKALQRAADGTGVNYLGGYSAATWSLSSPFRRLSLKQATFAPPLTSAPQGLASTWTQ